MSDDEAHPNLKFYPFVVDLEGFHREVHTDGVCMSLRENIPCLKSSYDAENENVILMNRELKHAIKGNIYQLFPTAQSPMRTTLNNKSKSSLMLLCV